MLDTKGHLYRFAVPTSSNRPVSDPQASSSAATDRIPLRRVSVSLLLSRVVLGPMGILGIVLGRNGSVVRLSIVSEFVVQVHEENFGMAPGVERLACGPSHALASSITSKF